MLFFFEPPFFDPFFGSLPFFDAPAAAPDTAPDGADGCVSGGTPETPPFFDFFPFFDPPFPFFVCVFRLSAFGSSAPASAAGTGSGGGGGAVSAACGTTDDAVDDDGG